ncbi:MAG: class I SAM-dependent methyltransferase [Candidatus Diapherotrites archaeon]|nr:class I SAM-dependent methyltransferase [Candidatus Diapherotrites archaeon]
MNQPITELYKPLTVCRICDSTNLTAYLELGNLPLANRFLKNETDFCPRFPLTVLYCNNCSLSQLSVVVDPEFLFSHYLYKSSISATFREHCAKLGQELKTYFPEPKNTLTLDIASNDGCLLKEFKDQGFKVLGVDPAENLAKKANELGLPTICAFWDNQTAEQVMQKEQPEIITATNVFAHTHDVKGFVAAIKKSLAPKGITVIEFHYMGSLIMENAFDTIYHEHVSYFLLKPLMLLFEKYGLRIFKVKLVPIHGGALRLYAAHSQSEFQTDPSVTELLEWETQNKMYDLETYLQFKNNVKQIREDFVTVLKKLKAEGKLIAGFGAAAKGNTLLNYCGMTQNQIQFIVDETPEKQGLLYAGTNIPIYSFDAIDKYSPNYIVIFPWNFSAEIIKKIGEKTKFTQKNGKYIIPIPKVRIME